MDVCWSGIHGWERASGVEGTKSKNDPRYIVLVWEHAHWLQGRVGVKVFQLVAEERGLVLQ